MTKIANYACFRTINQILKNAGLVPVDHSNSNINGRKQGFTGFWKNPNEDKYVYVCTDMMPAPYGNVLIRSAKNEKDFTGGYNQYAKTAEGLAEIARDIVF